MDLRFSRGGIARELNPSNGTDDPPNPRGEQAISVFGGNRTRVGADTTALLSGSPANGPEILGEADEFDEPRAGPEPLCSLEAPFGSTLRLEGFPSVSASIVIDRDLTNWGLQTKHRPPWAGGLAVHVRQRLFSMHESRLSEKSGVLPVSVPDSPSNYLVNQNIFFGCGAYFVVTSFLKVSDPHGGGVPKGTDQESNLPGNA
jgi:hypothetical protein